MGRHITVDTVSKKSHNSKQESHRTLFIGNLPFNADEEELRSFFESQIKKRKGKNEDSSDDDFVVESVKIVRSKDTRTGKGFGYVTLKVMMRWIFYIVCCIHSTCSFSER